MLLFLDTNILCSDFFLRGPSFRVLEAGRPRLGLTLVVPELVILETENKFREDYSAARTALLSAESKLGRYDITFSPRELPTVDDAAQGYGLRLRQRLVELDAVILPLPSVDHGQIVRVELRRQKPFGGKGSGYRDYLIWRSIVEHLIAGSDRRSALITNNSKDFAEGDALHPDLARELEGVGVAPTVLSLYASVEAFNSVEVTPHLEQLSEIRSKLVNGDLDGFDIREWVREQAGEFARDKHEMRDMLGFMPERTSLDEFEEVVDLQVGAVNRLPNGDLAVHVKGHLKFQVEVEVDRATFYESSEARWIVDNFDPELRYSSGTGVTKCRFKFGCTMVLDGESHELLDIDVFESEFFSR